MCCFVILLFRDTADNDTEVVDFNSNNADIGHINTNHANNIINIDLMAMNMLQGMFCTIWMACEDAQLIAIDDLIDV